MGRRLLVVAWLRRRLVLVLGLLLLIGRGLMLLLGRIGCVQIRLLGSILRLLLLLSYWAVVGFGVCKFVVDQGLVLILA